MSNTENLLFIDIETAPQFAEFNQVPEPLQKLWAEKLTRQRLLKENETLEESYGRAGLYAEFGKIICIVAGFFEKDTFQLRSFSGDDEKQVLIDFSIFLEKFILHRKSTTKQLCAHNGKEFDYPYIARRMLINKVPIPAILDNAGKKPWEVNLIDTLELWKFGDYKAFTSLNLLAYIFGLPSPKQELDGSKVGSTYWQKRDLESIVKYCCIDVVTLANVYLCLRGLEPFNENIVVYKP
ncbi:MAG TPA: ribonuclease H-like domain-containing protein [Bacteroidia bacterium]|nr:ribonuclease H-like domain-containing protein [Bacteroidia bacterium]